MVSFRDRVFREVIKLECVITVSDSHPDRKGEIWWQTQGTTPICDNGGKGQLVHPQPGNVIDSEQPPTVKGTAWSQSPYKSSERLRESPDWPRPWPPSLWKCAPHILKCPEWSKPTQGPSKGQRKGLQRLPQLHSEVWRNAKQLPLPRNRKSKRAWFTSRPLREVSPWE